MFILRKPNQAAISKFLERQSGSAFSYSELGASRSQEAPRIYTVDHNRVLLGYGEEAWRKAIQAIRQWKMFDTGFVSLCFENTPIEVGQTVAILVRHLGFWSLNSARIVYVINESGGPIERYGFAYGTLEEHAERGEERFSVEFHKADGSVWYDLYAFSQPKSLWARLGYPFSRYLQRRFAVESMRAMQRAVESGGAG